MILGRTTMTITRMRGKWRYLLLWPKKIEWPALWLPRAAWCAAARVPALRLERAAGPASRLRASHRPACCCGRQASSRPWRSEMAPEPLLLLFHACPQLWQARQAGQRARRARRAWRPLGRPRRQGPRTAWRRRRIPCGRQPAQREPAAGRRARRPAAALGGRPLCGPGRRRSGRGGRGAAGDGLWLRCEPCLFFAGWLLVLLAGAVPAVPMWRRRLCRLPGSRARASASLRQGNTKPACQLLNSCPAPCASSNLFVPSASSASPASAGRGGRGVPRAARALPPRPHRVGAGGGP